MAPQKGNGRFDAVLFDFGGVLISSPFEALHELAVAMELPFPVGDFLEEVFGPYHQDTDHPWHRIERGEIGFGDYFDDLVGRLAQRGVELDLARFAKTFGGLQPHEHMVDLVEELSVAGYQLAMVTNNIAEGREQWGVHAPVDCFDVIIDSSAVGMRKPDPGIYRLALQELEVSADRAVFLDDAPGNVDGARAVGLHAIWVTGDGRAAEAELRTLLGLT
ncbi:MAG TPA: HAD family phosphatase [Acidimicrobiales bacterium]